MSAIATLPFIVLLMMGPPPPGAHPRLLFRGEPPAFPWPDRLGELRETTPGLALHWHYTRDEASARRCLERLEELDADEGYGLNTTGPILDLPLAYDWLAPWDGFDREARARIEAKIARTAELCVAFLEGRDDHVFHTSAPRALMGVGLAGLVLEGHHPKADDYLAFTRRYLEKVYLPSQEYLEGAAVAGMSYGVTEGFAPLCWLLWGLKTAKGADYFAEAPWLKRRLHYVAQSILPDQTFVRWGDIVGGGRASTRDEVRPVVDMLAAAYDDPAGRALGARIDARWGSRHGYHAEVLWNAPFFAAAKEGTTDIALPNADLFGARSVGQAFFRSGWGDGDTVVFFKAGDYFDDHGHFDQGSFTIYRRGHLALDSFAYGQTGDAHRQEYGRHTVAHNALLIGEGDLAGSQRVVRSQDSQDLADHLEKKKRKRLETADVVAWKTGEGFTYLSADVTAAYDPQVVKRVTRELVWLDGRHLIVLDRVAASAPARFLLHAERAPKVEADGFTVQGEGARLVVRTVLPEKPEIRAVKGFISDGIDHPPPRVAEFHVPGGHRVEVGGGRVFLHVLSALDPGEEPPEVTRIDGRAPGVRVGGREVIFSGGSGVPRKVTVKSR